MKVVYVAGAMNADNILDVLANISRGVKLGQEVLKEGHAPIVPHLDIAFKLQGGDDFNIPMDMYYKYTLKIMTKCDAVIVCEKSETSNGTIREIETANDLGIPVYYSIEEFISKV